MTNTMSSEMNVGAAIRSRLDFEARISDSITRINQCTPGVPNQGVWSSSYQPIADTGSNIGFAEGKINKQGIYQQKERY